MPQGSPRGDFRGGLGFIWGPLGAGLCSAAVWGWKSSPGLQEMPQCVVTARNNSPWHKLGTSLILPRVNKSQSVPDTLGWTQGRAVDSIHLLPSQFLSFLHLYYW